MFHAVLRLEELGLSQGGCGEIRSIRDQLNSFSDALVVAPPALDTSLGIPEDSPYTLPHFAPFLGAFQTFHVRYGDGITVLQTFT